MLPMLVLIAGLGLVPKPTGTGPATVTFNASDGVTIYANVYPAEQSDAPVILLFHQANSSKNEYLPIAPQLVRLGYNVVAIDQRSGGDLYPPPNETVQHLGHSTDYGAVLLDMDAALAYAKRTFVNARVYAWGSSYSAALVFEFAAKHPHDLSAVIAFSPDEFLDDSHAVANAARKVRVPVFIDSSSDPREVAAARTIYSAVGSHDKTDYVPKNGVHGASTLRDDRDPSGAGENWSALTAFLAHLPKGR